jgi:hypothetical protein
VGNRRVTRDGGRGSGVEDCVEYARGFVRGFITAYMAWFLGLDAEDGFWSDYFWPLERLWSINRAQKDVSIMRSKGLIDVNRLRFTERGWGCMEHALVEFLRREFNGVNIVKEYPQVALIAPGFVYEYGVDLLDVANALEAKAKEIHAKEGFNRKDVLQFIMNAVEAPEVSYNSPSFMKIRVSIGNYVRSFMKSRVNIPSTIEEARNMPSPLIMVGLKYTPSRWLTPVIPYLVNMGLTTWNPFLRFCGLHPYYSKLTPHYNELFKKLFGEPIEPFPGIPTCVILDSEQELQEFVA